MACLCATLHFWSDGCKYSCCSGCMKPSVHVFPHTHTLAAQKPCYTYILLNMQEDEKSCKLQAAIISRLIITIIKQQNHEHQQWSRREWEGWCGRNRRVKKFYRVIHRSGFNRPISLIRLHPCIVGEDGKALTTGHARACVTVTLHWSLWLLSTSPWWCRPSS